MKTVIEALRWARDVADSCEKKIAAKAKLQQDSIWRCVKDGLPLGSILKDATRLGGMAGTAAAIKEIIEKKLVEEVEKARHRLKSGGF
jgi:hypothetical protein